MKSPTNKTNTRAGLMHTIFQVYMDLFVIMQSTAVAHWLMLELTFAQARALFLLAARKELTVSQLAKLLGVGNPTASILVQQLFERGFITRTEHATDRRQIILRLSEKGGEIGIGRRKEREQQWQRWLSHLSDEELTALARGLSALRDAAQMETGSSPPQAVQAATGDEVQ